MKNLFAVLAFLAIPVAALAQSYPSPIFKNLTTIGTVTLGGSTISLGGNLTTSGANSLTITTTGPTNVTLPTSGTLLTTTGNGSTLTGILYSQPQPFLLTACSRPTRRC